MNTRGNVRTHSVNVGSALVAGPIALGRRPYTRLGNSVCVVAGRAEAGPAFAKTSEGRPGHPVYKFLPVRGKTCFAAGAAWLTP